MSILIISTEHALYPQVLDLRQRILRKPLGLDIYQEDLEAEKEQIIFVSEEAGKVEGCLLLQHLDAETFKLRQMAVDVNCQRKGIGARLLHAADQYAISVGKHLIMLHARKEAISFYEASGYTIKGEPFTEIGIPHIKMEKTLL